MIFDPKIDPKMPQDGPKTDPRGFQKRSFFILIFAFDFRPFWGRFGVDLGSLLNPKIDPKSNNKLYKKYLRQHTPKRPPQEASRVPQEAPRPLKRPQDPPKRLPRPSQEAPRRLQKGPNTARDSSKWLRECPKMVSWNFSPKGFVWFCNCIPWLFCLHLQCKSRNLSKGRQEAPKTFQSQMA